MITSCTRQLTESDGRWDEKRVEWIGRRMEMIIKEMKERFQGKTGVEYRVDKQAVEKKPATKITRRDGGAADLGTVHDLELLLLYEVMKWEQLF